MRRLPAQEFNDGYVEWSGHDEDGEAVEGTAEVKVARLGRNQLEIEMDYGFTGVAYTVRLRRDGEQWRGTHRRAAEDRALPIVGSCTAVENPTGSGDRCFHGRWLEDDVPYRWTLLLRAPTKKPLKLTKSAPPPPKTARLLAPHPDIVRPERPATGPRTRRELNDFFKVGTVSGIVIHDIGQRRGLEPPAHAEFELRVSDGTLAGRGTFFVADSRPKRVTVRIERATTRDFFTYVGGAELTACHLGPETNSGAPRVQLTFHSGECGVATLFSESADGNGEWFAFVGHRLFGIRWAGAWSAFDPLKRHLEYQTLAELLVGTRRKSQR